MASLVGALREALSDVVERSMPEAKLRTLQLMERSSERKARKLLEEFLSPAQQRELSRSGTITVMSNRGRMWRIYPTWGSNVRLLEQNPELGLVETRHMCIVFSNRGYYFMERSGEDIAVFEGREIPIFDLMLAVYLLIKNDERKFLSIAN